MEDFSFFSNNTLGGENITFKYRYRKQIIIGGILLIFLLSVSLFLIYKKGNKKEEEEIVLLEKKETEKEENDEKYKVDIKGEINNPGIYSLDSTSRVIDVIEKAGGLTENADTSVINLSKKIIDEMVIIIYSKEQVLDFEKTKEIENQVVSKCNQKDDNSLVNDACISTSSTFSSNKISINTATKEELMTLPGIGEAKAKDIITYREENGPFKTLEELLNISGIGENILAQIKENITL